MVCPEGVSQEAIKLLVLAWSASVVGQAAFPLFSYRCLPLPSLPPYGVLQALMLLPRLTYFLSIRLVDGVISTS